VVPPWSAGEFDGQVRHGPGQRFLDVLRHGVGEDDQSPYLQGFLSVLYLYLFRLSGTLVAPPVTDTGLTFVTKENVGPYASADSRFEGGAKKDVIAMPSAIPLPPATTLSR
jgi:simple sugar transport system substrate-binding protein